MLRRALNESTRPKIRFALSLSKKTAHLWLHLRNALDLALQDQEALVVEVDAFSFEQGGDFGKVAEPAVDGVLGRVVAVRLTSHDQLRVGHDRVVAISRLARNIRLE